MWNTLVSFTSLLLAGVASGCHTDGVAEQFEKTSYFDGAGNREVGNSGVTRGIRDSGHPGDLEVCYWTTSFNPVIDHLNVPASRLCAGAVVR